MRADRVFLDANILFSVAYGSQGLRRLWDLARNGHCALLASEYVIEEARRNLETSEQLDRLNAYLSNVKIVPEADQSIICPIDLSHKDIPVLGAAVAARADYLITGDRVHFSEYFGRTMIGVKILMARDYFLSKTRS